MERIVLLLVAALRCDQAWEFGLVKTGQFGIIRALERRLMGVILVVYESVLPDAQSE